MPILYPDLQWYSLQSERKGLPGRCPYTSVHLCPRYFETYAVLSMVGTTVPLQKAIHDEAQAKWENHELSSSSAETVPSISGGEDPNCYSNFCPEVAYDTFKLFASNLIRINDSIDRQIAENLIEKDPAPDGKDWRYMWSHVEPLHYSDCPLYARLHKEKPMSNITFHGPVSGNINVAGYSVNAPVMSLSIRDLIAKIDASNVDTHKKEEAKSKLSEFLNHPVVAAIIGGLAGHIG